MAQPADLSSGAAGSSEAGGVKTDEAGSTEVGRGETEAGRGGTEAARGGTEAARGGETEAARGGDTEAARGGDTEAGAVNAEAGRGDAEAGEGVQCCLCNLHVEGDRFTQHLSDHHTEEQCDTCGAKVQGTVGLLNHIQVVHYAFRVPSKPSLPPSSSCSAAPHHTAAPPPAAQRVNWKGFLPDQFRRVIQEADQVWVSKCLYEPTGQLKQKIQACWFHPPLEPKPSPPEPGWYFRQRLFIWAPMRMWGIPSKCPQCSSKMNSSGIYRKVREVIDVDSRYYLVGADYPRCCRCSQPVCP